MINIEHLIPKLKGYFLQDENIIAVWIVGSYGTAYQRENSDIDFAILFDKGISVLDEMYYAGEITQILQIEDVDLINLRKAPITLQMKALQEGRKIYEKDTIKTSVFVFFIFFS
ncbi:MAG TPA: nucleotidyltransferase domain-containing protein [Epulopiscium sp.]|nr:nucleotidyltransferase domain-containing protein [Candidatus Epulonipiscium sp.]